LYTAREYRISLTVLEYSRSAFATEFFAKQINKEQHDATENSTGNNYATV
jgi:hypothetical protein